MQFMAQYAISKQFSWTRSDRVRYYLLQTLFSERLANAEYKVKIIFAWKKYSIMLRVERHQLNHC